MKIILESPVNCHLWKKEKLESTDLRSVLESVETYVDENHFSRQLVKCKDCGQLYFMDFYEEIDWEEGNDPQYTTFLPVETKEEIELLKNTTMAGLADFSPRLQKDFPKEADSPNVYWVGK